MRDSIRVKLVAAALCGLGSSAAAQTIQWNAAVNGTFSVGANWVGGVAPGAANNANFGVAGTYAVTFINSPTNTSLGVSLGNVTFSGAQLYTLSNIANISGGSLNLNGTDVSSQTATVNGNSRLTIGATSELSALDVNVGNVSANNGTILVNGGTLTSSADLTIGLSGGDGTVSLTGDSDGIFNQINLANSGIAGSGGTLLIANTSVVSATGAIFIGSGGVASQVGLLRQSDSTNFTQIGAVGITVGAAANSVGTLDVLSGNFISGTGTIAINPTGTVRVGSGAVFNANGNMNINGGVFDFSSGTVNFAANQTVTLSNGAQALPTLGSGFAVNSGRTWNVNNSSVGGLGNFNLAIGTSGNGTMIVNSGTIDATSLGVLNMGAAGATGTLSLLNGSVGIFNSLNSTAGAARITVSGGSTLSFNNIVAVTGAGPSTIALNTGGVMQMSLLSFNNGTISMADAASRLSTTALDLQAAGAMNISGGSVSIGSGTSTVVGTITLTGGSIQFAGPLNLINGDIVVTSPGILRPLFDTTSLNNSRITAPSVDSVSTLTVGADSLIGTGSLTVGGPLALITTGSALSISGTLDVAHQNGGDSTLTLQHTGTTATIGGATHIGGAGEGTLILTDSAAGTFTGGMNLAEEFSTFNTGVVVIDSSATAFLGDDLRMATQIGGLATNGSVTISNGGVMTLSGAGAALNIGATNGTAATITVNSTGRFLMNSAATVSLNSTGTIIINGGEARLGTFLADPAGQIVFSSGTLGTTGVFNVSPTGALGPALNLAADRALHHGGTFTINGGTVAVSGGTLTVGTFGASTSSINFQSGFIGITGANGFSIAPGQMLGSALTLNADRTLSVSNGLTVAGGAQLHLAGGSLSAGSTTINGLLNYSAGAVSTGTLTVNSGGRVLVGPSVSLDTAGQSTNAGRVELAGGIARIAGSGSLINSGLISGDGEIALPMLNTATGEIRVDAGDTLAITNVLGANTGRITLNGGRLDLSALLVNSGSVDLTDGVFNAAAGFNNAGRVTGRGTLQSGSIITNNATITFSGGISDLNSPTFTNAGKTIITGTSVTTFFGAVTNTGGSELRVSAGATAVFLGDVTGASSITGGGAKIFEAGASGLLSTPGDSIVEAFGNLSLQHIRERSLTINGGLVAIQFGGTATGVSRLSELNIAGAPSNWDGQFDLSNNGMVIDYTGATPLATVVDYLKNGFANGAFDGQGISSSAAALQANRAIGIAEASDIGAPLIFLGQAVDPTSLLLRFTLPGDANLDALVDIGDFALLAGNFNTQSYWARGDFNYDAVTDIGDFALLASNFNQSLPLDLPRLTVPEPVCAPLVAMLFLGGLSRRRGVSRTGAARRS